MKVEMVIRVRQTAPNTIAPSSQFSQRDGELPGRLPIVSGAGTKDLYRQKRPLIPVQATVYWWRWMIWLDQAQALDRLPELTEAELKALGGSLATAISKKLGVDVAP